MVVERQHRPAPRLVGKQPQAATRGSDIDARALQPESKLIGILGERRQADVQRQPLDQGLQIGLVAHRLQRGRTPVDQLGEAAVLRLASPRSQITSSRDDRDRVEQAVRRLDVVVDDEALTGLIAQVADHDPRQRRTLSELALKHACHRRRVQQHAHLRERDVRRGCDAARRSAGGVRGTPRPKAVEVRGELLRGALPRDAPGFDLHHPVRRPREGRRVGDHDRGTAAHEHFETLHDCGLALRVETCGRLVQDEDRRIAQDGARNRDPLPLPTGDPRAALPEHRLVAAGQHLDEVVRGGGLRRLHDLLARRVDAVGDVVGDRPGEEHALLQDEPDLATHPAQPALADVATVDQHRAVERVVEAGDQSRERRLACARASDHRDVLSGRNQQREIAHVRLLGVVAEDDPIELDLARRPAAVVAVGRIGEHLVGGEDLGHAVGAGERLRDLAGLPRDRAKRTIDLSRVRDHHRQVTDLEVPGVHAHRADREHERDPDRAREVGQAGEAALEPRGADAGVPALRALGLEASALVVLRSKRLDLADRT